MFTTNLIQKNGLLNKSSLLTGTLFMASNAVPDIIFMWLQSIKLVKVKQAIPLLLELKEQVMFHI